MTLTTALQIGLPIAVVTVGVVTIAAANRSLQPSSRQAAPSGVAVSTGPMPSPNAAIEITVNGEPVLLDKQGKADIVSGTTRTTVARSGDKTTVTTTRPDGKSTTTNRGNGDLNISVESENESSSSNTRLHQESHSTTSSNSSTITTQSSSSTQ